jgi:molybdate transport system substrate-binding protein
MIALAVALAGCGGGDDFTLRVFGAASLGEVLPPLDPGAEYSFAASGTLATQIREGAPADVLVSADAGLARELQREGLLEAPRPLATNALAILVQKGDPERIRTLDDLRRPGIRFVMADRGVPLGDYARRLLASLGESDLAGMAASYENDAAATAAKVALGEADAAIGYLTDARAAGVDAVELPASAQPRILYTISVVAGSDHAGEAEEFVKKALGSRGRALLRAGGFGPP